MPPFRRLVDASQLGEDQSVDGWTPVSESATAGDGWTPVNETDAAGRINPLKANDPSKLPTRPVSAEDFTGPRSTAATLGDVLVGGAKGLGSSAIGLGKSFLQMVNPAEALILDPAAQRLDESLAATNTGEKIGKRLETAAEYAIPAYEGVKGAAALAQATPAVTRAAVKTGAEMLTSEQPLLTQLRTRVAKKFIGHVLDSTFPATASTAASTADAAAANAGSKLIPLSMEDFQAAQQARAAAAGTKLVKPPTLDDLMSQALTEVQAELNTPELPSRITTPPQPELPPGYTPRTTVPRAAAPSRPASDATSMSAAEPSAPARPYFLKSPAQIADEAAAASNPSAGARPYFLKSPEQIAEEASWNIAPKSKPTGSISIADLPEAWKSRTGQDIIPTQGALGKEVVKQFTQELKDRGLSTGQAIVAVSQNKTLPLAVRSQLLKALSRTGA